MPTIPIDDWTLHYQRLGDGSDVVLLHGLSGDAASWHPAVLGRLAAVRCLTLVDLRGHGRSGRPASGYTTRHLADDLARLLDALSIPRAHLIGHSFGGAVALHFALLHGDRARSLVLADARLRALQPAQGLRDGALWRDVRNWLEGQGVAIPDATVDSDLELMNTLARHRLEGRLDDLPAAPFFIPFAAGSPRRAENWLRLMKDTTAPADFGDVASLTAESIARLTTPALLLYGGLSHCMPTRDALAALLPGASIGTIEGAGHFHHLVKPDAFLAAVLPFLDRVEGTGAAAPPEPVARNVRSDG